MSVRKNVMEFIEKYKELECLWKVTDINYKNKQVRSKALEQLIPILKKIDEHANMDTVSKKINSLRSSFNKEYNKVQASLQWSPADIHIPKLWYYNLMTFLVDRDPKKKTSCDIEYIVAETSSDSQILCNAEDVEQPGSPNSQSSAITSVSEQDTQNTTNNLKRKIKNEPTEDSNTSKRLDSSVTKSKPTFTAFGEHVAEKLRAMDENAAKYCIKIINDAIFHAEFNQLNHTSRIVTDADQPHFQLVHKSTLKIHPNSP